MVNNTKTEILTILRANTNPVSGECIAGKIGKSRVAVWKAVQSLIESGYGIETFPTGYMLKSDITDSLETWEFGNNAHRFRHFNQTDSTMNRAREAALAGCESGLIISAKDQLFGKGTNNKEWKSASGGLFFTMITRPDLNIAYTHRAVLAAQIASVKAIRSVNNIETTLAWPNDIICNYSKAGGVLCETFTSGTQLTFCNIGVGINTGESPLLSGTTNIHANKKEVLAAFVYEFDKIDCNSNELIREWNALCFQTGKIVKGHTSKGESLSGIFSGITQYGWAIIKNSEINNNTEGTIELPPGTFSIHNKGWKK